MIFPLLGALAIFAISLVGCSDGKAQPDEKNLPDSDPLLPHPEKESLDCHASLYHSKYIPGVSGNPTIPLALHRITQEDGSGGFPRYLMESGLEALQKAFAPAGIRFGVSSLHTYADPQLFQLPAPTLISSAHGDRIKPHLIEGAINVFFVNQLGSIPEEGAKSSIGGYNVWKKDAKGILISRFSEAKTLPHEMGHHLGLLHTFINEPPGDEVLDTPPDPGPLWKNPTEGCDLTVDCEVISCGEDPTGKTYEPDADNLMSAYPPQCRNGFTDDQMKTMLCTLDYYFSHLIPLETPALIMTKQPLLTVGCDEKSMANLPEAMNEISQGGTIEVCEGEYQAHDLRIFGGDITIMARDGHRVSIDGNFQGRIFQLGLLTHLNLENLTLKRGKAFIGGAIALNRFSSLELHNVFFEDNDASGGSILHLLDSDVDMRGGGFLNHPEEDIAVSLEHQYSRRSQFWASEVEWNHQGPKIYLENSAETLEGIDKEDDIFCESSPNWVGCKL